MKLNQFETPIYSSEPVKSTKFVMESSPKAFMILSNMYKHKIRAIVRELSCNAVDAAYDRMLQIYGNDREYIKQKLDTHFPFEIEIPNNLEAVFRIRDFGTGLSETDMFEIYRTYFGSTKQDSNDFIGALGLGSKSPFNYSNVFNVISYFNGTKCTYSAFMHDGEPNIELINRSETDEPNGLEITIPVKIDDVERWRTEIKYVLDTFEWKPSVIDKTKPDAEYKFATMTPVKNYYILNGGTHPDGLYALMGNVMYPIPSEYYDYTYYFHGKDKIFILKFDIGELSFTPSREELLLDDMTILNVKNRINEIDEKLLAELEEVFLKNNEPRKVREILLKNYVYAIANKAFNDDKFKINGRTINQWSIHFNSIKSQCNDGKRKQSVIRAVKIHNGLKYARVDMPIEFGSSVNLIIHNCKKPITPIVYGLIEEKNLNYCYFVNINNENDLTNKLKYIDIIKTAFTGSKNLQIYYTSDHIHFGTTKVVKSISKGNSGTVRCKAFIKGDYYRRLDEKTVTVTFDELTDNDMYFDINNEIYIELVNDNVNNIERIATQLYRVGLSGRIFMANKTTIKRFENSNAINFFSSYLEPRLKKINSGKMVLKIYNKYDSNVPSIIDDAECKDFNKVVTPLLKKYLVPLYNSDYETSRYSTQKVKLSESSMMTFIIYRLYISRETYKHKAGKWLCNNYPNIYENIKNTYILADDKIKILKTEYPLVDYVFEKIAASLVSNLRNSRQIKERYIKILKNLNEKVI